MNCHQVNWKLFNPLQSHVGANSSVSTNWTIDFGKYCFFSKLIFRGSTSPISWIVLVRSYFGKICTATDPCNSGDYEKPSPKLPIRIIWYSKYIVDMVIEHHSCEQEINFLTNFREFRILDKQEKNHYKYIFTQITLKTNFNKRNCVLKICTKL